MYQVNDWKIKVRVEDLLIKLVANRKQHVEDYEEAVEAYRKESINQMKARVELLETATNPEKFLKFNLNCPVTYQKIYDRVIKMLKMTSDDVVEINGTQFAEWTEDEWGWSESFLNNTLSYKAMG